MTTNRWNKISCVPLQTKSYHVTDLVWATLYWKIAAETCHHCHTQFYTKNTTCCKINTMFFTIVDLNIRHPGYCYPPHPLRLSQASLRMLDLAREKNSNLVLPSSFWNNLSEFESFWCKILIFCQLVGLLDEPSIFFLKVSWSSFCWSSVTIPIYDLFILRT